MFITPAYAQTVAHTVGGTSDMLMPMVPLVLILLVFYVLIMRPSDLQRKRQDLMVAGIKKGDQVVTSGGLIGTIVRIDDTEVLLEIGENVRVRVVRSTISGLHGAAGESVTAPRAGFGSVGKDKGGAGG